MFERFTDQARRVVVLAQEEARLLNHSYIGTEHLLLGLIRTDEGVAAEALQSLGVTLELVRAQVEENVGYGQHDPSGHIPFTRRAKTVLDLSLRESLQLGHDHIGTEHLLLGLLREGDGVAARVLVQLGADLNRVRQQVIRLLSERRRPDPVGVPPGHHVEVSTGGRSAGGPSLRPVSDDPEVTAIRDSLDRLSPVAQALLNAHLAQLAVDAAADLGKTAEGLRSLINVIVTLHGQDPAPPPDDGGEHR